MKVAIPPHKHMIEDTLVVVSDVHIIDTQDERGRRFQWLLDHLHPGKVRHLVLLGDIFDFYFGPPTYFQTKYQDIFARLQKLAQAGVQVIYLQGNHEFAISASGMRPIQLTEQATLQLNIDGERLTFTHGDLISPPWHYRIYAQLVRSRLLRWVGGRLPPTLLDRLALRISKQSRLSGLKKRVPHRPIMQGIRTWMSSHQDIQTLLVGHFHVPYAFRGSYGKVIGLPGWEQPGFVGYHEKKFFRYTWDKSSSQIQQREVLFVDF
ncbi:MAG: metallophosphoesterase family protein [Zetaproteobacteria bacterium]|nr:metallophosphoesterase family protein [Zetaproteobacteria bacterium]